MPKVLKIPDKIQEIKIDNPKTKSYSLSWVNVSNAGKKEIDYLQSKFGFNIAHLQASVATVFAQRPMVENEKDYLFLILHFPTFKGDKIVPGEIEFFVGHGYLITLHNGNLKPLNDFYSYCQDNPHLLLSYKNESSSVLLYELLGRLIKDCYNILDQNSININEVEEIIFSGSQKHAVSKILELRRNIINIRKIMQNHTNVLKRLQEMKSSVVSSQVIKKYYESLAEHSRRIWEILDLQKEMVEVLNDTNESLLNDKMNIIMKTLTVFSVLVLPLNLLAGIFGMNTIKNMPFIDSPYGFWIILGIMFAGLISLLSIFYQKKWI
ncbi:MAG: magnesium transporter CorA family protein [Candidatus Falkowbacteria bacterium]